MVYGEPEAVKKFYLANAWKTRAKGGWPGLWGLKLVDMEVAERMSLRHFPRKYREVEGAPGSTNRNPMHLPRLFGSARIRTRGLTSFPGPPAGRGPMAYLGGGLWE